MGSDGLNIVDLARIRGASPFFAAESQASLFAQALAPTTNIERAQPNEPYVTQLDYYSPYDQLWLRNFWTYTEYDLFNDYTKMYRVNPFAHFIIEALTTLISGEGYHFEGDESSQKDLELFFFENRLADRLKIVIRHMLLYGNGYLNMKLAPDSSMPMGQRILSADYVNGSTVKFERGKTGDTIARQYTADYPSVDLDIKKLLHFKMWDTGDSQYGMSVVRPNYMFLMALFDMVGDIPMAVKRAAYVPLVVKLNLTGIDDTTRATYVKRFRNMVTGVQAASTNFVIDNRHDILYPENSGRGLNLPLNELLVPIFSIVLLNAGVTSNILSPNQGERAPIGGLAPQQEFSYKQIRTYRRQIEETINNYLVPLITSGSAKFIFNRSPEELRLESRIFVDLWGTGALSRETLLDKLDIVDEGTTFIEKITTPGGGFVATRPRRDD